MLRKNIFTLLCLSFVVATFTSVIYAQGAAPAPKVSADQVADDTLQLMRQDVRSERKKIVAANLPLTETEAVKFWPVYDRYVVDHSKIYDTRFALIKEYAQNYNTLTDEQARNLTKGWIKTEEDMAQLRLKWMPEFEKVISKENRNVLPDRPASRLHGRTSIVIPNSFGQAIARIDLHRNQCYSL